MFKAPIKVLHPLLTATQEGNYIGTENVGAIPFRASSSRTRTKPNGSASSNKNNEAFLDRICVVNVPYCLRVDGGDSRSTRSCWRSASSPRRPARPAR